MKTASVADLRNDFRRVGAWIAAGEEVRIVKRGKPFAKLVPMTKRPKNARKVDFAAQLKEIWGDKVFTTKEWEEMREWERSEDKG